jgi:hypothetical protein
MILVGSKLIFGGKVFTNFPDLSNSQMKLPRRTA